VLVIPALDRLARNAKDAHEIFARLERAGVAIRSLRGEVDTTTPTGKLMTGVMASLAEFESNVIGERTRSGKAAAARAGRPNGGPRRFGFDQRDGVLIPRPSEIAVVERILREVIAGRSQTEIAVGLNADGHKTARGKRWNQPQISQLLADPIWVGDLRNREGVHHVYEPFVPVELWEAAQKTLRGPDGPRAGRRSQRFLLGNGLLRCGQCGSAMIVRRDRKDYGYYEAYLCYGRTSGQTDCTQVAVQRAPVDSAVLAYFERVGLDVEATRAELAARADRDRSELRALRGQAERELAKAE
jgi:site-specific DNA recombinase